jgi:hypothetical protein
MQKKLPNVFLALPVMNESDYLPELISCINKQSYKGDFYLFSCINQPDEWWTNESMLHICQDNARSELIINKNCDIPVKVINRYSKGKGWKGKKFGVGWARKTVMDEINNIAQPEDVIISIDADTKYNKNYISFIVESILSNPDKVAVSVPYYHNLTNDNLINRSILHYEIYMRYYSLNLWRIDNPYNFTALGSAIALPVWAYRKVRGISPHKSGEDFYFLQKLRKTGELILWNDEKAYPASRYSDRVFFGTGPALIKGKENNWKSYPIYHYRHFDRIKELYSQFEVLYEKDVTSPLTKYFEYLFNSSNLWQPLRDNYKTKSAFIKACEHKIDALRILQYIKAAHKQEDSNDEKNLIDFLEKFVDGKDLDEAGINLANFSFINSTIEDLDKVRNFLANKEERLQIEFHKK